MNSNVVIRDTTNTEATVRLIVNSLLPAWKAQGAKFVVKSGAKRAPGDSQKLARLLYDFCKANILYRLDPVGKEYIRSPDKTWADRASGVDCEDYVIFVGAVLLSLNVPFWVRTTDYGDGQGYSHIYVVLADGSVIDPVMDVHGYEHIFVRKLDLAVIDRKSKKRGLSGLVYDGTPEFSEGTRVVLKSDTRQIGTIYSVNDASEPFKYSVQWDGQRIGQAGINEDRLVLARTEQQTNEAKIVTQTVSFDPAEHFSFNRDKRVKYSWVISETKRVEKIDNVGNSNSIEGPFVKFGKADYEVSVIYYHNSSSFSPKVVGVYTLFTVNSDGGFNILSQYAFNTADTDPYQKEKKAFFLRCKDIFEGIPAESKRLPFLPIFGVGDIVGYGNKQFRITGIVELGGGYNRSFLYDLAFIDGKGKPLIVDERDLKLVEPASKGSSPEPLATPSPKRSNTRKANVSLKMEIEDFIANRPAGGPLYTPDELAYINQYEGAGGMKDDAVGGQGLLYEFYTPEWLAVKMYELAKYYGYRTGQKVLEPSCGTGRLVKPFGDFSNITAFEVNPYSAKIAQANCPGMTVFNEYFETSFLQKPRFTKRLSPGKTWLEDAPFDLVIGNPPYGFYRNQYSSYFAREKQVYKVLELIFFHWALSVLRPGGLVVFLVPQNIMRTGNLYQVAKSKLYEEHGAELLDAYRLPKVFANSAVPTDLIILRKTK